MDYATAFLTYTSSIIVWWYLPISDSVMILGKDHLRKKSYKCCEILVKIISEKLQVTM